MLGTDLQNKFITALYRSHGSYDKVVDIARPEYFLSDSRPFLQALYNQIEKTGRVEDLLLIKDFGAEVLTEIALAGFDGRSVELLAEAVREEYMCSKILGAAKDAITNTQSLGAEYGKQKLHDAITSIDPTAKETDDFGIIAERTYEDIVKRHKSEDYQKLVDTGLPTLNKIIGGYAPTDQVVIGAGTGIGKTWHGLTIIRASAESGTPSAMFSLEMSSKQLAERVLASESQVDGQLIRKRKLEDYQLEHLAKTKDDMQGLPISLVSDCSTWPQIEQRIYRLHRTKGTKLFVIDYVGLVRYVGTERIRTYQIGEISRDSKQLCRDLGITIIWLAQLRRREDVWSLPSSSDLADSASLERDSDFVILGYKPFLKPNEDGTIDPQFQHHTTWAITKSRHGDRGAVETISVYGKLIEENMDISNIRPMAETRYDNEPEF